MGWTWAPTSLLFIGYLGSFLGVKQLGHEFDRSLPTSANMKCKWGYTPTICLHKKYGIGGFL